MSTKPKVDHVVAYEEYNIPFERYQSISCPMGTLDLNSDSDMVKAVRIFKNYDENNNFYNIFLFLLLRVRKYSLYKSKIISIDTIQKYCTLHQTSKPSSCIVC